MSAHAFVDETMRGGYLMAAALLLPADLAKARKAINALVLPGQRRLHFCTERDDRRRQILSTITSLQPEILIYDASTHSRTRSARRACLERLVDDLSARNAQRLVIEQADDALDDDRRQLYENVHRTGCADRLTYVHERARTECLLAIPDATAWCWRHKGSWRERIRCLVTAIHKV